MMAEAIPWLTLANNIFIFGLLYWIFTLHGTSGLVRTNSLIRILLATLILIEIYLLSTASLYLSVKLTIGTPEIILLITGLTFISGILVLIFLSGFPAAKTAYTYPLTPINEDCAVQNLHIAVGGDVHFGGWKSRTDLTMRMLKQVANPANDINYFFILGDLVQFGFRPSHWQTALRSLSSTLPSTPIKVLPGNHDTLFNGIGCFKKYLSPNTAEPEVKFRLWSRNDLGNIHFLALDLGWSGESYTPEQAKWLEDQLQSIPQQDWKIIMSHGFYYCSGSRMWGWRWYDNPQTIRTLTPLFEKYGVDLVFSGHAHQLELLQKSGVTYIVSGSFGGVPDPERRYKSPFSLWYAAGVYGFVEASFESQQARISFRNAKYEILKEFIINKDPKKANSPGE